MTPLQRRATCGLLIGALAAGGVAIAVAPVGATEQRAGAKALNGTFKLTRGTYSGGKARGTWFRMILRDGKTYFRNPDSRASNKTYTLGTPGSDGGLVTGGYQPHPSPPFDRKGNARASRIVRPQPFTAINFSVATLSTDPQSKKRVGAPSATVNGRALRVRIPGYTAEWNGQYFNQGAPKPDGSGSVATGIYNARTKRFMFEWRSKVVGGPFNGFTGLWHFEGTFSPR